MYCYQLGTGLTPNTAIKKGIWTIILNRYYDEIKGNKHIVSYSNIKTCIVCLCELPTLQFTFRASSVPYFNFNLEIFSHDQFRPARFSNYRFIIFNNAAGRRSDACAALVLIKNRPPKQRYYAVANSPLPPHHRRCLQRRRWPHACL